MVDPESRRPSDTPAGAGAPRDLVPVQAVRIHLVTADLALLERAIHDPPALGRALGCDVAEGWAVFPSAVRRTRDTVAADPGGTTWGARFFVLVELGYAVAPGWEGRGLATAAAIELLREAFAVPDVTTVVAHTRPEPGPSVRVLEKAGFVHDGEVPDVQVGRAWRFRLDRPGTRRT
jgi:ribosomal-protein-alanine N-acetyltransferase